MSMKLYKDCSIEDLFKYAASAANCYANEIKESPQILERPEALKYRALAVKQHMEEIIRRANELDGGRKEPTFTQKLRGLLTV